MEETTPVVKEVPQTAEEQKQTLRSMWQFGGILSFCTVFRRVFNFPKIFAQVIPTHFII